MIASSPYLFSKMILLKINKGNYAQFTHKINLFICHGILQNKLNNENFAEYLVLRNLEEISETQKELYFGNINFKVVLIENLINNCSEMRILIIS